MEKDMVGKIAVWAFLIGTIIAVLVGLYQAIQLEAGDDFMATDTGGMVAWLLAVIGAIVGILAFLGRGTITKDEVPGFLLAAVALLVMYGVFQGIDLSFWIGSLFEGVSQTLAIFIAPAAGLLAIKAIWDIGRSV